MTKPGGQELHLSLPCKLVAEAKGAAAGTWAIFASQAHWLEAGSEAEQSRTPSTTTPAPDAKRWVFFSLI